MGREDNGWYCSFSGGGDGAVIVPVETIVGRCVFTPTSLAAQVFFADGALFALELSEADGRTFCGSDWECGRG